MNIKVQYKETTANAIINSGLPKEDDYLTFHCFSDQMKARILENLLKSPNEIYITICDDPRKTGEWFEQLDPKAKKLQ